MTAGLDDLAKLAERLLRLDEAMLAVFGRVSSSTNNGFTLKSLSHFRSALAMNSGNN